VEAATVVGSDELAIVVDAEGIGLISVRDLNRGEATICTSQEASGRGQRASRNPHDPAAVVDVGRDRRDAVGRVDGRENAVLQQEAVRSAGPIYVLANDVVVFVDAERLGSPSAGDFFLEAFNIASSKIKSGAGATESPKA